MARLSNTADGKGSSAERAFPPGRTKIANALISLLQQKEFSAVTTAEIARTVGVTEALIYKYFHLRGPAKRRGVGNYFVTLADAAVFVTAPITGGRIG